MLRLVVLALVFANAGYFAWGQGWLRDWGLGPASPSEPQHVQQQIRPDAVRILPASEARGAAADSVAVAGRSAECLLAGPIGPAQLAGVKAALAPWPAGSWTLEPVVAAANWVVYMGPYAGVEQLARKKAELRRIGVAFDALADAALEPGLSLGRYASETEASARLQALATQGVRSARVVQDHPATAQQLKLAAVDETLRPRVEALRPVLDAIKLRPCRAPLTGDKT